MVQLLQLKFEHKLQFVTDTFHFWIRNWKITLGNHFRWRNQFRRDGTQLCEHERSLLFVAGTLQYTQLTWRWLPARLSVIRYIFVVRKWIVLYLHTLHTFDSTNRFKFRNIGCSFISPRSYRSLWLPPPPPACSAGKYLQASQASIFSKRANFLSNEIYERHPSEVQLAQL